MRVCCITNLTVGAALAVAGAFGGCSARTLPPADPSAATGAPSPDEAATPTEPSAPEEAAPAESDPPTTTAAASRSATPPASDTPPDASARKGEDARSTAAIAKLISEHRQPVRECYEKARKELKDLRGSLTIHFVLDPEGKVKSAELNIERSEIKARVVVDCAIAVIKSIQFPPSSRGMQTSVNYPYDFKP